VNKGLLCVKGYHVGSRSTARTASRSRCSARTASWCPSRGTRRSIIIAAARRARRLRPLRQRPVDDPRGLRRQQVHEGRASANNHIDPNARLCMASAVTGSSRSTASTSRPAATTTSTLRRADHVGQQPRRDAPGAVLARDRPPCRAARGHAHRHRHARTRTTEFCRSRLDSSRTATSRSPTASRTCSSSGGTYDKAFVAKHCNFRKRTPSPPTLHGQGDDVRRVPAALEPTRPSTSRALRRARREPPLLAELFGRRDLRITSLWCMGMNQHTRGTAINAWSTASTCSAATSASRATRPPA
jgi:nitrate reductase NapA